MMVELSVRLATADSSSATESTIVILPDGEGSSGAGKHSDIAQLI